ALARRPLTRRALSQVAGDRVDGPASGAVKGAFANGLPLPELLVEAAVHVRFLEDAAVQPASNRSAARTRPSARWAAAPDRSLAQDLVDRLADVDHRAERVWLSDDPIAKLSQLAA